ncbi:MAG: efflux RND transporter periplasmic adaptor subunit [Bacteroidales bacterium]
MKTLKYIFASLSIFSFLALSTCSNNKQNSTLEHQEHNDHEEVADGLAILNESQRKTLDIKTGSIQKRNMSSKVNTNGHLVVAPQDKADITSFMEGNVKSIKVFQGDKVTKGDIIATLEHPNFIKLQQEFVQNANELEYLKKEFQRQKTLYENKVGSGKNFQQVQANFNIAKANFEGLKLRVKLLNLNPNLILNGKIASEIKVIAPISGYISKVNVNLGSFVNAESKMFSISNNDNIHADLLIYEKDIPFVKEGQKLRLNVANQTQQELEGVIFSISREYQNDSKAVIAHANILTPHNNLIEDSYVNGEIFTENSMTLALPETAIVNENGKSYIFALDNNATQALQHKNEEKHDHSNSEGEWAFKMIEVITGIKDGSYVEIRILDSLPSNKVVLDGAFYILSDLKKSEAEHNH